MLQMLSATQSLCPRKTPDALQGLRHRNLASWRRRSDDLAQTGGDGVRVDDMRYVGRRLLR
jgi:hypothetical protein